jgi:signal transduction histidine kinase
MSTKGGNGLAARSIRSFWLFGLALMALYGLVVAIVLPELEDQVFERRLDLEVDHFLSGLHGPPRPATPFPSTRFMRGYWGSESLPAEIRPLVEGRPDGIVEIGGAPWELLRGRDYHVAIRTLPEGDKRFYLVYDVSSLEVHEGWWSPIVGALLVGLATVVPLGLWWGRRLAARVVSPIVDLAEAVDRASPDDLGKVPDPSSYPREVATLATALKDAMRRVDDVVERERRFTRNASHELRTPVTVIRGAVELLELQLPAEDAKTRQQLQRIARSVVSMEEIIEAFLWLARGAEGQYEARTCRLEQVLPLLVERNRHLLREKDVEVRLDLDAGCAVEAPEPVVAIAVGNLLANAFANTARGSVHIAVDASRLVIADTGQGIDPERLHAVTDAFVTGGTSGGHGLGLAIVKEICQRFGWHLELRSRPGEGTETILDLSASSPRR